MFSWNDVPTKTLAEIEAEQAAKIASIQTQIGGARFAGRFGCSVPQARSARLPIAVIRLDTMRVYRSARDAEEENGYPKFHLRNAVSRRQLSFRGIAWRYATPEEVTAASIAAIGVPSRIRHTNGLKKRPVVSDKGEFWWSMKEAAAAIGVRRTAIEWAIQRNRKCKGRVIQFATPDQKSQASGEAVQGHSSVSKTGGQHG